MRQFNRFSDTHRTVATKQQGKPQCTITWQVSTDDANRRPMESRRPCPASAVPPCVASNHRPKARSLPSRKSAGCTVGTRGVPPDAYDQPRNSVLHCALCRGRLAPTHENCISTVHAAGRGTRCQGITPRWSPLIGRFRYLWMSFLERTGGRFSGGAGRTPPFWDRFL
jgi:hypothetical protein